MILTNKIDVYKTKKFIQGQGQGQISNYTKNCFNYKSWTGDWTLIILIHDEYQWVLVSSEASFLMINKVRFSRITGILFFEGSLSSNVQLS